MHLSKLALHDTFSCNSQELMLRVRLQQHIATVLACVCFGVLLRFIVLPDTKSPCGKVCPSATQRSTGGRAFPGAPGHWAMSSSPAAAVCESPAVRVTGRSGSRDARRSRCWCCLMYKPPASQVSTIWMSSVTPSSGTALASHLHGTPTL